MFDFLKKDQTKPGNDQEETTADIVSLAKGRLGFGSVSSSIPSYEREHP